MNADQITREMADLYVQLREVYLDCGASMWEAHVRALQNVKGRWAHQLTTMLQAAVERLSIEGPPRWAGTPCAHYFASGSWAARCGRPRTWVPSGARACRSCVRLSALDLERSGRSES